MSTSGDLSPNEVLIVEDTWEGSVVKEKKSFFPKVSKVFETLRGGFNAAICRSSKTTNTDVVPILTKAFNIHGRYGLMFYDDDKPPLITMPDCGKFDRLAGVIPVVLNLTYKTVDKTNQDSNFADCVFVRATHPSINISEIYQLFIDGSEYGYFGSETTLQGLKTGYVDGKKFHFFLVKYTSCAIDSHLSRKKFAAQSLWLTYRTMSRFKFELTCSALRTLPFDNNLCLLPLANELIDFHNTRERESVYEADYLKARKQKKDLYNFETWFYIVLRFSSGEPLPWASSDRAAQVNGKLALFDQDTEQLETHIRSIVKTSDVKPYVNAAVVIRDIKNCDTPAFVNISLREAMRIGKAISEIESSRPMNYRDLIVKPEPYTPGRPICTYDDACRRNGAESAVAEVEERSDERICEYPIEEAPTVIEQNVFHFKTKNFEPATSLLRGNVPIAFAYPMYYHETREDKVEMMEVLYHGLFAEYGSNHVIQFDASLPPLCVESGSNFPCRYGVVKCVAAESWSKLALNETVSLRCNFMAIPEKNVRNMEPFISVQLDDPDLKIFKSMYNQHLSSDMFGDQPSQPAFQGLKIGVVGEQRYLFYLIHVEEVGTSSDISLFVEQSLFLMTELKRGCGHPFETVVFSDFIYDHVNRRYQLVCPLYHCPGTPDLKICSPYHHRNGWMKQSIESWLYIVAWKCGYTCEKMEKKALRKWKNSLFNNFEGSPFDRIVDNLGALIKMLNDFPGYDREFDNFYSEAQRVAAYFFQGKTYSWVKAKSPPNKADSEPPKFARPAPPHYYTYLLHYREHAHYRLREIRESQRTMKRPKVERNVSVRLELEAQKVASEHAEKSRSMNIEFKIEDSDSTTVSDFAGNPDSTGKTIDESVESLKKKTASKRIQSVVGDSMTQAVTSHDTEAFDSTQTTTGVSGKDCGDKSVNKKNGVGDFADLEKSFGEPDIGPEKEEMHNSEDSLPISCDASCLAALVKRGDARDKNGVGIVHVAENVAEKHKHFRRHRGDEAASDRSPEEKKLPRAVHGKKRKEKGLENVDERGEGEGGPDVSQNREFINKAVDGLLKADGEMKQKELDLVDQLAENIIDELNKREKRNGKRKTTSKFVS